MNPTTTGARAGGSPEQRAAAVSTGAAGARGVTIAGPGAAKAAEKAARWRLGIPDSAERVLVLCESTHWDPNWLLTSEEYFRVRVRRTLDLAVDALLADPRRVYSVECTFFVRMYWERVPHRRDDLRTLVNEGRMRFTGSGVTTPDTLLPSSEAILRDLLIGQEWLRTHGMNQEPRLLYLPDSFGHSPNLPTLLRAGGFDYTAVTRIDGMYLEGTDWEPRRNFPRPGSSAARLWGDERSLDFVWRDANGAEVLAHWNAFGYGQGDLVAGHGVTRWMGVPAWVPDRRDSAVARNIERFADALTPLSRTPYLLCPIGYDFISPVRQLGALVERFNDRHADSTGLFVVNAGADDYLDLVATHRHSLPVIAFDPNPYWTGFYASRPALKAACVGLVDDLLAAEAGAAGEPVKALAVQDALAEAWQIAAVSNHHDFITGTSPDRVVAKEQWPWLRSASASVELALDDLGLGGHAPTSSSATAAGDPPPDGSTVGSPPTPPGLAAEADASSAQGRVVVEAAGIELALDRADAGSVTVSSASSGEVLLAPGSLDVIAWEDTGGLWRMGHEYRGGRLSERARASAPCSINDPCAGADEDGRRDRSSPAPSAPLTWSTHLAWTATLAGRSVRRQVRIAEHPSLGTVLVFGITVGADDRTTVTARFRWGGKPGSLEMDQPGGPVSRPVRRLYDPTFWPVPAWLAVRPAGTSDAALALALAVDRPTAIAVREDGSIEIVVARNANKEHAWGRAPLPAMPARGHEPGEVTTTIAVAFTSADASSSLFAELARIIRPPATLPPGFGVDRDDVIIDAVKPAHRGGGTIIRLRATSHGAIGSATLLTVPSAVGGAAAVRADSRERDVGPIGGPGATPAEATASTVTWLVEMVNAIETVRMLPDPPA